MNATSRRRLAKSAIRRPCVDRFAGFSVPSRVSGQRFSLRGASPSLHRVPVSPRSPAHSFAFQVSENAIEWQRDRVGLSAIGGMIHPMPALRGQPGPDWPRRALRLESLRQPAHRDSLPGAADGAVSGPRASGPAKPSTKAVGSVQASGLISTRSTCAPLAAPPLPLKAPAGEMPLRVARPVLAVAGPPSPVPPPRRPPEDTPNLGPGYDAIGLESHGPTYHRPPAGVV